MDSDQLMGLSDLLEIKNHSFYRKKFLLNCKNIIKLLNNNILFEELTDDELIFFILNFQNYFKKSLKTLCFKYKLLNDFNPSFNFIIKFTTELLDHNYSFINSLKIFLNNYKENKNFNNFIYTILKRKHYFYIIDIIQLFIEKKLIDINYKIPQENNLTYLAFIRKYWRKGDDHYDRKYYENLFLKYKAKDNSNFIKWICQN